MRITLPKHEYRKLYVGGNKIARLAHPALGVEADILDSVHRGLLLINTPLPSPLDIIFLVKPNTRPSVPPNSCCLELIEPCAVEDFTPDTRFRWKTYSELLANAEPDEIVQSWKDKFSFVLEDEQEGTVGLRLPQIGALHAISAYFSLKRNVEPATVVLPTGTGKTETMLSTLVSARCEKILVLVPSDALRTQISNKFLSLGYLRELGVLAPDALNPLVAVIKKGIRSAAEADEILSSSNVIVATVSILSNSSSAAVERICQQASHLFVDEAHHISAYTWASVREKFEERKVLQFTATPFRNDGKSLGGRIIYNYSMGEAQEAGYFKHINLLSVEEYYEDGKDRAIAQRAIAQLREDLEARSDHILLARVTSKVRADAVFNLYLELAPDFNPICVHSGQPGAENARRLDRLLTRQSRVVVCVDMLGEGYDLPNLKVAAIHDHHKSLAVTLQFIGRFTRTAQNIGDASIIVNIAEPEVENDLEKLYAQGADWDVVLRRLAEERITREVKLQEVVDNLKQKGNLHHELSLWNLKPGYSAMLFRTQCENWNPERFTGALPKCEEHWYSIAEDEHILVVLTLQNLPIKWGDYKELGDIVYKLLIAHWDQERNALFIYSNDYKSFRTERLAQDICGADCELMSGNRIFNIFNGMEFPLIRNLGASKEGAISFTQYFGPNVTDGLSQIERSLSKLSNCAGMGYVDGDRVIWGCSEKKGKVWSVKSGAISDWIEWASVAWDKVVGEQHDEDNITRNFLRPQPIDLPYGEHAVSVLWGEHIISAPEDSVTIHFGENQVPFYLVDLEIEAKLDTGAYRIRVFTEDLESKYDFMISGQIPQGFSYLLAEGPAILIQKGRSDAKPLEEYMISDPWIINYVDGSFSYNCHLIKVTQEIGQYDANGIEVFNWDGIDIRKESMGKNMSRDTIQYKIYSEIVNDYDIVINDDDAGEAADLVCLKDTGDEICLTLVHCKFSSGDAPGARVADLYAVCGQSQKSIHWKHAGLTKLYQHIKKRENTWRADGYSRFLKGQTSDLLAVSNKARTTPIKFQVVIVQPGLARNRCSPDMLRLLGSTALYVEKTSKGEFRVIGS